MEGEGEGAASSAGGWVGSSRATACDRAGGDGGSRDERERWTKEQRTANATTEGELGASRAAGTVPGYKTARRWAAVSQIAGPQSAATKYSFCDSGRAGVNR